MKIVSLRFDDDGEADQFAAAARARGAGGLPMVAYLPKDQADAPWLENYAVPGTLARAEMSAHEK